MILTYAALLQGAGGGPQMYGFVIQIGLVVAIFYFLIIRPQQKQRTKHEDAIKQLKKGDEIVTAGGIIGRVVHVRETVVEGTATKTLEDRITIESGESRFVVERGRIAKILGGTSAPRAD